MRKFLAAMVVACSLAVAAPAHAEAVWVATDCYAGAPYNSQRTITVAPDIGPVFHYRNVYSGGLDKLLYGNALWYYANAGFDCGRFGLLYDQGIQGIPAQEKATYYWFYFVKPGSCDLRYIITLANNNRPTGLTYDGVAVHYFC